MGMSKEKRLVDLSRHNAVDLGSLACSEDGRSDRTGMSRVDGPTSIDPIIDPSELPQATRTERSMGLGTPCHSTHKGKVSYCVVPVG